MPSRLSRILSVDQEIEIHRRPRRAVDRKGESTYTPGRNNFDSCAGSRTYEASVNLLLDVSVGSVTHKAV